MRIFQPASVTQKVLKMQDEINESIVEEKLTLAPQLTTPHKVFTSQQQIAELMQKDPKARYQLVEEIIVARLAREFRSSPQRDMSLRNNYGGFVFDAVFDRSDSLTVVEVKILSDLVNLPRFQHTLQIMKASLQALPFNVRGKTNAILAIAHDMPEDKVETAKGKLAQMAAAFDFPVELRWFDLADILKEIEG